MCVHTIAVVSFYWYTYRAPDTFDMTNKHPKCNFIYLFKYFFNCLDTFNIGYFLVMHHAGCSIHHVEWNFDTFDMRNNILNLIYFACFISFNTFDMGYFIQPCNIACSMYRWHLWHTLDLAKLALSTYQFLVGKFS